MQVNTEYKSFWDEVQASSNPERLQRLRSEMERVVVQPALEELERQRRGAARIRSQYLK